MDWSQLAGTLLQAGLPALGGLFGGPLGSTVGGIVGKAVAGALGVEPTPQAVAQKVEADPGAARVQLAAIEAETQRQAAVLEDVANARSMTVQLVQSGSNIAWGPVAFSLVATVGFVVVSVLAMRATPGADRDVTLFLLGAWNTAFASVMAFWVGSSQSSRAKDQQLGAVLQQAVTPSANQVARDAIAVAKRR